MQPKNPKTFEKILSEAVEGKTLDLSKIKFYLSKGVIRISCHDEKQQEKLSKVSRLGDIQVTATRPWMLTKSSENTGKMDDESRPEKAPKIFKYVISGVSKEIS